METRVLTVPSHQVNQELAIRQAFGWQLSQTSARSFATGGGMVGAGVHVGSGIVIGGGQVAMQNAHYTDLVLQRFPGPRTQWLAGLEHRYDSVTYRSRAPYWIIAVIAALVFIAGVIGGAAISVAAGNGDESISPHVFTIPFFAGIAVGWLTWRAVQKRRDEANRQSEALQQQLLQQARTGPANRVAAAPKA